MSEITTINPATEDIIKRYTLMSRDEVERIIQATYTSQLSFAHTPLAERKTLLLNIARLLKTNEDHYANLITTEMGKPINQSRAEIQKCARLCEYYAQEGEAFLAPEMIKTEFQQSYRSFHPLGIILAIMPWNFPFWQVMRFAIPNLMLGNACLLKHAPNSFGAALAIETLLLEAGFPPNVFRSLFIDVDLAPHVIQHNLIAGVTLTGSNRAGKSIAKEAGEALKKVVLELGGSDPYVVLEDADLNLAAEQCVLSRLNNAGQVCISAKRMIVVDKVCEKFTELVLEKAKTYVMGNPLDTNTKLGPMARGDLRKTLHTQVTKSIAQGAECLLGAQLPSGKGYYYPATVLVNVTPDSLAFQEELFGPVICITSAANDEEAIQLANATEFGLAGAIFTQDIEKGNRLARDYIEAGTVAVNVLVASDPRLPFGGIKQSGYGRELAKEGMREFANIKTVIVK